MMTMKYDFKNIEDLGEDLQHTFDVRIAFVPAANISSYVQYHPNNKWKESFTNEQSFWTFFPTSKKTRKKSHPNHACWAKIPGQ